MSKCPIGKDGEEEYRQTRKNSAFFLFDVSFLFKALNGNRDFDFSQFLDSYCQDDRYSLRYFDTRSLKRRYARRQMYLKTVFFSTE